MKKMKCHMYKYSLNKNSSKHICPNCEQKRFVLYIDNETKKIISPTVGRCDREIKCGYHYPPKQFFIDNNQEHEYKLNITKSNAKISKKYHFHNSSEISETLKEFDKNNFIKYLKSKFDNDKVEEMMVNYKIGTAPNKYYGTIFWQVDLNQKIRAGKIIWYDELGKRTKYINWIHSINIKKNKIQEFNLNQCFFGEHLLQTNNKIIAIVESEKTACIMSMLFDKYLWLASGSVNGISLNKLQVLKYRKIILYPDLGIDGLNGSPYTIWKKKSIEFKKAGFDINISDLLENNCSENDKFKGYDIADYFLKNLHTKTKKIITNKEKKLLELYMKNKNLKTLVDVFDLIGDNGKQIRFE